MTKVMAVILNYNSIEDSKKCATLLKEQQGIDLHIVIVDNCSTDGKVGELETFGRENNVMVIVNYENRGFSAGNNIGLRKAAELGCEYAMIINPDVEIRDNEYISKAVDKMNEDGQIAVLGTDVINMKGQHQNPMREPNILEDIFWPFMMIRNKVAKTLPYTSYSSKSGYCQKVSGCCFFVRMSFMKKVDFLDETVFLYSEEPILAAVVKREGLQEYFAHDLVAFHMHNESVKGDPIKRINTLYESRKYYLEKYSGFGRLRIKCAEISLKCQRKIIVRKHR